MPAADQNVGRLLAELPDEPVPAVPRGAGPRIMAWLSATMALLGLAILFLTVFSGAPLAKLVGMADVSTATVTDKEFRVVVGSSGCDYFRFEVQWADRDGYFTVCNNPDYPATRLEVGDQVEVTSVPWSGEVTAEGTEGGLFWAVTGLISGLGLVALGAAWVRRYRRLMRGGAVGARLSGHATKSTRNALHVVLDTPALEGRRMLLLPAKGAFAVDDGDHVDLWASRRSWLGGRPRGPWAVQGGDSLKAFTHGWLRRG